MKLIIDTVISIPMEMLDEEFLQSHLFSIISHREVGEDMLFYEQKLTLTEVDMNTIFSEALMFAENTKLTYANLGGVGCDFSMRIVQNRED